MKRPENKQVAAYFASRTRRAVDKHRFPGVDRTRSNVDTSARRHEAPPASFIPSCLESGPVVCAPRHQDMKRMRITADVLT